MAEYLSPAVFIEELPSGIKPIEGVGTSTAAFVGHAERGPIGVAVPVNNFATYVKRFGGYIDNGYLPFAVKAFFDEGGTSCYVVRTCHYAVSGGGTTKQPTAAAGSKVFKASGDTAAVPADALQLSAASPGAWGNDVAVIVPTLAPDPATTFTVRVQFRGVDVETFTGLTMDKTTTDYVETRL